MFYVYKVSQAGLWWSEVCVCSDGEGEVRVVVGEGGVRSLVMESINHHNIHDRIF